MAQKKGFHWRGWITFFVTISFIIDTVSGIVLYISPPGRIANWTHWTVWGITKEEWGAIHTIFGYVLLIIVGIHLYYNWKMFWNFIWSKVRAAFNLRWEMAGALLISLLIFLGTLWDIPPFSSTMDLGDYFKGSWEENKADTPIPHAELLTLKEFAEKTQIPLDSILKVFESKGYPVKNSQQTLGEIAEENDTTPNDLYEAIKSKGMASAAPKTIKGSGLGQKKLEALCSEYGISLDEAMARLKEKGVKAEPGMKIKEIASGAEKKPSEILKIITNEKKE